ncbi:MAG: DMT family transporter [Saprospiraceae bacterium]|nr:DMT family transporter [Saprospiraceae bacterium]
MKQERRSYIELHIAVLLYGLTAILGDLIQLPAIVLVWWRVLITSLSLLSFIRFGKDLLSLKRKTALPLIGIGCLVAIHWICFYGSIKLSNASVGLIAMATTSVFTSLLEPWIMKRRVDILEIIMGLLIILGMLFIVQTIDLSMKNGFMVGFAAAFFAALFGTLNKKYVDDTNPYIITFVELGSAWAFISVLFILGGSYMDLSNFVPVRWEDWMYILILALLCTTLAYILSLRALKHLTAFATNLVINLEPLYGILLAAAILKEYEQLTTNFYIGGGIIIAIIVSYPILKKRFSPSI